MQTSDLRFKKIQTFIQLIRNSLRFKDDIILNTLKIVIYIDSADK
jgi:hypothetical protein